MSSRDKFSIHLALYIWISLHVKPASVIIKAGSRISNGGMVGDLTFCWVRVDPTRLLRTFRGSEDIVFITFGMAVAEELSGGTIAAF